MRTLAKELQKLARQEPCRSHSMLGDDLFARGLDPEDHKRRRIGVVLLKTLARAGVWGLETCRSRRMEDRGVDVHCSVWWALKLLTPTRYHVRDARLAREEE